jgi:hypothetical protein
MLAEIVQDQDFFSNLTLASVGSCEKFALRSTQGYSAASRQIGSDHVGQDGILRRIGNPHLPVLNN